MSAASSALAIIQAAAVLNQIVDSHRKGELTDKQLQARWDLMQEERKANQARWKALEDAELDSPATRT